MVHLFHWSGTGFERDGGTVFKVFPRVEVFLDHSHVKKAFLLAHGFARNLDGIGVVDDTVADGVGKRWVVQVFVPFTGIILRTEDGGGCLVPCLYQFQYIPCLCLLEGDRACLLYTSRCV